MKAVYVAALAPPTALSTPIVHVLRENIHVDHFLKCRFSSSVVIPLRPDWVWYRHRNKAPARARRSDPDSRRPTEKGAAGSLRFTGFCWFFCRFLCNELSDTSITAGRPGDALTLAICGLTRTRTTRSISLTRLIRHRPA